MNPFKINGPSNFSEPKNVLYNPRKFDWKLGETGGASGRRRHNVPHTRRPTSASTSRPPPHRRNGRWPRGWIDARNGNTIFRDPLGKLAVARRATLRS